MKKIHPKHSAKYLSKSFEDLDEIEFKEELDIHAHDNPKDYYRDCYRDNYIY